MLCFFVLGGFTGRHHLYTLHLLFSASGHHLQALPFLCSRVPVSPREELLHMSDTLVFVAITWGTPLDYLTLHARGILILVSMELS